MEDEQMRAEDEATYERIRKELLNAKDEVIISSYLKRMIINGDSWPDHFIQDVDVFDKNPNEEFHAQRPIFVIVKPRIANIYGQTEGCESGCWRIIGREKLIKSEETRKFLGFKKILKFCKKTNPREYKRDWVMEEYRVVNKLNWKQDHVICKIRLLFEEEISSLLAKHFSYLPTTRSVPVPSDNLLPAYGVSTSDPDADGAFYLRAIIKYEGNSWPKHVTNDMDRLPPLTLVDPQDKMFQDYGTCIFFNRKSDDGCCWIVERDSVIRTRNGNVIGHRRVLKFSEEEKQRYVCEGDVKGTWLIEEYRFAHNVMPNKVLCVIKLIPIPPNRR